MQDIDATDLARALRAQRAIRDEAAGLALLVLTFGVWWLSPLAEPQPFTGAVLLVAGTTLAGATAVASICHERVIEGADALILAGFLGDRRRTPVERAVWDRLCWIERPRSRRRLAQALRWRLRLATGAARLSPGYLRAAAYPPLGPSERSALLDSAQLVVAVADEVAAATVDPRALVLLWALVGQPTHHPSRYDQDTYDAARSQLLAAWALVADHRALVAVPWQSWELWLYGQPVDDVSLPVSEAQRVAEFRAGLRRFHARTDQAAREAGLTPQRYLLLVMIKGAPDGSESATASDLADRLEMPQTTISDLVGRAQTAGLLRRDPSTQDGRVVHLRLSDEGERRLALCIRSLDDDRAELERTLAAASRRLRSL